MLCGLLAPGVSVFELPKHKSQALLNTSLRAADERRRKERLMRRSESGAHESGDMDAGLIYRRVAGLVAAVCLAAGVGLALVGQVKAAVGAVLIAAAVLLGTKVVDLLGEAPRPPATEPTSGDGGRLAEPTASSPEGAPATGAALSAAQPDSVEAFVLGNIDESVILHRPSGEIIYANSAAWEARGYTKHQFMALPPYGWAPRTARQEIEAAGVARQIADEGSAHFESSAIAADGRAVPIEVWARAIEYDGGPAVLASARDVTDHKEHEAAFQRMAFYDELTGIANRALFLDRLRVALAQSARSGRPVAVLFMDLDFFKQVNDTYGHTIGDEALRAVASRLAVNMRDGDTLARLGGDEFTFVLPDIEGQENAETAAAKFLSVFRQPFDLAGHPVKLTASIGIAVVTGSEVTVEEALARADAAMYRSKEGGRDGWHFYRDTMRASVAERFALRNRVGTAIDRGEFLLYFQPQLDAKSGKVAGAEALVRWNHPERGILLPNEFLDLVEEAGMLDNLGREVVRIACEKAKPWVDGPMPAMRVSVNVAPRQIFSSSFCDSITEVLAETGFDPGHLQIEVNETAIHSEPEYIHGIVEQLHSCGVTVAIDHFGTGFNSLERLRHTSVDCIKIDRSFTTDIEQRPDAAAIANTVVTLAHHLGLEVVAEAIERPSQAAFLKERGVDTFQGFLFCEPLGPSTLTDLLESEHRFVV
jgi:diguanylate cyclase (GGDEF)-like protein/PAS domain S-box-containing protein